MNKQPLPGEIWVKFEEDGDTYNSVGDKVLIAPDPTWEVAWQYIPRADTACRTPTRDNAWSLEPFLNHYRLDETSMIKKILKIYDETNTTTD